METPTTTKRKSLYQMLNFHHGRHHLACHYQNQHKWEKMFGIHDHSSLETSLTDYFGFSTQKADQPSLHNLILVIDNLRWHQTLINQIEKFLPFSIGKMSLGKFCTACLPASNALDLISIPATTELFLCLAVEVPLYSTNLCNHFDNSPSNLT